MFESSAVTVTVPNPPPLDSEHGISSKLFFFFSFFSLSHLPLAVFSRLPSLLGTEDLLHHHHLKEQEPPFFRQKHQTTTFRKRTCPAPPPPPPLLLLLLSRPAKQGLIRAESHQHTTKHSCKQGNEIK